MSRPDEDPADEIDLTVDIPLFNPLVQGIVVVALTLALPGLLIWAIWRFVLWLL